jgi:chemotaxis signal transduction protein
MSPEEREWLRFRVGNAEYAIVLDAVCEVTPAREPNFVPLVPLEIGGILNVRGEPLPAVDARALTGAAGERGARPALVLEKGAVRIGLLVDTVTKIERGLARSDQPFDAEAPDRLEGVEWIWLDGDWVGLVDADGWMDTATGLLSAGGGAADAAPSF